MDPSHSTILGTAQVRILNTQYLRSVITLVNQKFTKLLLKAWDKILFSNFVDARRYFLSHKILIECKSTKKCLRFSHKLQIIQFWC